MNNRPLTHISDDVNDLQPLTPNHILLGMHKHWDYVVDTDARDISSRRKWREVQAISCLFWERWRREYLPKLTKRSRWKQKNVNFRVGELVLLDDDNNKFVRKGKWVFGRITKVLPGDDGIVRVIELRTKEGTYVRPVAKLFKLEDEIPQGEGYVVTMTTFMLHQRIRTIRFAVKVVRRDY